MINPAGLNIEKCFTVSGYKEIGDYKYVLLIDFGKTVLIKRIEKDNVKIKFALKKSGTIEAFWEDPTEYEYNWINNV